MSSSNIFDTIINAINDCDSHDTHMQVPVAVALVEKLRDRVNDLAKERINTLHMLNNDDILTNSILRSQLCLLDEIIFMEDKS